MPSIIFAVNDGQLTDRLSRFQKFARDVWFLVSDGTVCDINQCEG
jgi:hypothetical protein